VLVVLLRLDDRDQCIGYEALHTQWEAVDRWPIVGHVRPWQASSACQHAAAKQLLLRWLAVSSFCDVAIDQLHAMQARWVGPRYVR